MAAGCEKKGNTSKTVDRHKGTEGNRCQILFQDGQELRCQAESTQERVLQNLHSLVFSQREILSARLSEDMPEKQRLLPALNSDTEENTFKV